MIAAADIFWNTLGRNSSVNNIMQDGISSLILTGLKCGTENKLKFKYTLCS